MTPVSVSSNYGLPPTPTTATDPTSATGGGGGGGAGGYMSSTGLGGPTGNTHGGSLSESIPSPRSLSGGLSSSSWAAYSGATGQRDVSRTLSPSGVLKTTASPNNPNASLRLSTLPTVYDTRSSQSSGVGGGAGAGGGGGAGGAGGGAYGLPSQGGHHGMSSTQQGHNNGRWDYSVNAISDTTNAYGSTRGGGYDYGAYGDGASQRA